MVQRCAGCWRRWRADDRAAAWRAGLSGVWITDMRKGMVGLAMPVRTGMLSVLASLVLGLLIATAKTSHDSTDLAIRNFAAELALLNEALRDYGGPASVPRDLLREYIEAFERQGWPRDGKDFVVCRLHTTLLGVPISL